MAVVDVRSGEHRAVFSGFAVLLGITGGHTMLETARDALFLAKLPPSRLPIVYLGIAVLGLALARLRARKSGGTTSQRAIAGMLFAAAGITVGFWAALQLGEPLVLYALYLWTGLFASWVVVEFWMLLGASFTVSQAKRLFGFIGAGSVLGAVLGAALARVFASLVVAEHLLLIGAGFLVLTAIGPTLTMPEPPPAEKGDAATKGPTNLAADWKLVASDTYVRRILALLLLSTVVLTGVDYLFKAEVAAAVPKEELGAYFAGVYVIFNAVALVVQLGAVGVLFRVLGVHRALWIMPVLVLAGSVGIVAVGGLTAALLLKSPDGTLRHSLHKTSAELLYVPIADRVRARVKPLIDLIGQRGGQALASVVILGFVTLGASSVHLGIFVAVLAAGWFIVALSIQGPYLGVFRAALREGRIGADANIPDLDLAALEALFAALNSRKDAEVIGALDLLSVQKRQQLIPALVLYHPSKPVVMRAFELFQQQGRDDYLPIAERLADQHADPEVRAAAVRARAAMDPDESWIRAQLEDGMPEVRATALVTLIARKVRSGTIDDEDGRALFEKLEALRADPSMPVRLALVRAIGTVPIAEFDEALHELADDHAEVARAVADAFGHAGRSAAVPKLIALLARRGVSSAARNALARIGEPALSALDRALGAEDTLDGVRWSIPRAILAFPPHDATRVLVRHLRGAADGLTRFRVLRSLARARQMDASVEIPRELLHAAAEEVVRRAFRLLRDRIAIEESVPEGERGTAAHQLVVTLLRDKYAHAFERLFLVLGLTYREEDFARIHQGLLSDKPKVRASSRELCENALQGELKPAILVLADDLPDREKLLRGAPADLSAVPDGDRLLVELSAGEGTLASLAAFRARELGLLEDSDEDADTIVIDKVPFGTAMHTGAGLG